MRHRALAEDAPDEALAAELTEASRKAWARAAWLSATELLELAVERSEDPTARDERALALARRLITQRRPPRRGADPVAVARRPGRSVVLGR